MSKFFYVIGKALSGELSCVWGQVLSQNTGISNNFLGPENLQRYQHKFVKASIHYMAQCNSSEQI